MDFDESVLFFFFLVKIMHLLTAFGRLSVQTRVPCSRFWGEETRCFIDSETCRLPLD